MSDNDNLICADCINSTLMEEKKRRDANEKNYYNNNSNGFFTDGMNSDQKLLDERRRQREYNTNEAIQNLAKINAGLNSKDKLIQINENSRNPLNDGTPDYQYQKFQDEYQRRQKMINDNINKFCPKPGNERTELSSYYDNYVNNPNKYNTDNIFNNMGGDYSNSKNLNKKEYFKSLEEQINYKNELKKREKEDEKRREREQYDNYQKELKRQEEEKYLKKERQKEELMKANKDLIEQKNKQKRKELQENLKFKELYERQNDEYQKELQNKELENERKKNDLFKEYENRKRMKDNEKEKYNDRNNNLGNENYEKHLQDKNRNQVKERMGRCCKCHRVFPRRLLTINRYFYKENRK